MIESNIRIGWTNTMFSNIWKANSESNLPCQTGFQTGLPINLLTAHLGRGVYIPWRIIQLACLGSGKVMRKLFEMSFDPQITNVFLVPVPRQDKISNNLVLTKVVIAASKYNWLDKAKDKLIWAHYKKVNWCKAMSS